MLKMTSCVKFLIIYEIKVWGVELLNCYNSDDQCGRFNNFMSHFLTCKCHIIFYVV